MDKISCIIIATQFHTTLVNFLNKWSPSLASNLSYQILQVLMIKLTNTTYMPSSTAYERIVFSCTFHFMLLTVQQNDALKITIAGLKEIKNKNQYMSYDIV